MGQEQSHAKKSKESCDYESRFLQDFFTKFNIHDKQVRNNIQGKLDSELGGNSESLVNLSSKKLKAIFGEQIGEYFLIHFHPEKREVVIKDIKSGFDLSVTIESIDEKLIIENFEEHNPMISTMDWNTNPYVIIQYKNEKNRVVWKLKKEGVFNPLPIDYEYHEILLPLSLEHVFVPNDEHVPFQNEASYLVNWTIQLENMNHIDLIKVKENGYNGLNKYFHSIHFGIHGPQRFLLAFSDTTNTFYTVVFNTRSNEKIGSEMKSENDHGMVNKDFFERASSIPILSIFQCVYDKVEKESKDKKINFVMCGNRHGGSIAEILTVLLFEDLSGNYASNCNILSLAFNAFDWCDANFKSYLKRQNYSIMDRPISTYLKRTKLIEGSLFASSSSIAAPKSPVNFALDKEMIKQTISMKLRVSGANTIVPKLTFESDKHPLILDVTFGYEPTEQQTSLNPILNLNANKLSVNSKSVLIYEGEKVEKSSSKKYCSVTIQTHFDKIEIQKVQVESYNSKFEFHMSQLQTLEYYMIYCNSKEFEELSFLIETLDSILQENPKLTKTIKDMREKNPKSPNDYRQFGKTLQSLNEKVIWIILTKNSKSLEIALISFFSILNPLCLLGLLILNQSSKPKITSEFWNEKISKKLQLLSSSSNSKDSASSNTLEIEKELVKQIGCYLELKEGLDLENMPFKNIIDSARAAENKEPWYSWFFKMRGSLILSCMPQILSVVFIRRFLRYNYFIAIFGTKDAGKSTLIKAMLRHVGSNKEAAEVKSGLGNAGETLGISMFSFVLNGKKVNLVDFPGSDGLTTNNVFKEGKLQLDIAIAMTDVTQGINQGVIEVVHESLSNSPQTLMVLNNQADKLQADSIGPKKPVEVFKANTLNELNFGLKKYSGLAKTKRFSVDMNQMYLTAIKPKTGTEKKNGILYGEDVVKEIIRICDQLR